MRARKPAERKVGAHVASRGARGGKSSSLPEMRLPVEEAWRDVFLWNRQLGLTRNAGENSISMPP